MPLGTYKDGKKYLAVERYCSERQPENGCQEESDITGQVPQLKALKEKVCYCDTKLCNAEAHADGAKASAKASAPGFTHSAGTILALCCALITVTQHLF